MAIDKDFVIKSGLQVNENLIYADPDTDKVGLGTTNADRRLVVIGDQETSGSLLVGTAITAQRLLTSGFTTAIGGIDVGVGGTILNTKYNATDIDGVGVGINSTDPRYTLEVIGPVSIGDTAQFIYGDLTVTGNISGSSLSGQISAGGTVGFTNVTVEKNLDANNAEVYTLFRLQEFGGDRFRFLSAGDPPGIGFTQNADDPEIYLVRGQNYQFDVDSGGFPFYIKTQPTADLNNIYTDGVVNNGIQVGIVTFKVPFNAPNELYYQASNTVGMGGSIFISNDGKGINVAIATITQYVDAATANADFLNIYVSGIGTINNLKGPQNFSVSAGILTVRQDRTALIGVSTGTDGISIQEKSDSVNYQVPFTPTLGIGSNYQNLFVDSENDQMMYNPATNVLTVDRLIGNVTGVSTGADNINVDQTNTNTDYQIIFSDADGSAYQRMYIDTDDTHLTYNPSTETLTVENINGGTFTGTATNAQFINVDVDNQNTNHQILFSANQGVGFQRPYIDTQSTELTYNPSTNTFSVSNIIGDLTGNVTGDLAGTATNANFINVDEINSNTKYQLLFSTNQAAGYQRPYIDSDSNQLTYNPSTRTFSVQNVVATTVTGDTFTGTAEQANLINVDETGSNLNYQVLFSTNQAAGYQRPYIDSGSGEFIYNPSTNRLTVGNFTGNGAGLTNLDGGKITTGIIDPARLPAATNTTQGAVIPINTYPPVSNSTVQPPSADAFRRLYQGTINIIPTGTRMLFYQSSAPVGWTKITTQDNKAVRVVSSSGGGSGGSNTFTTTFGSSRLVPVPRHSHTGDASANNGQHSHTGSGSGGGSFNGGTGGGGSHTHTYNEPFDAGAGAQGDGTGFRVIDTRPGTIGGGSHNHNVSVSGNVSVSNNTNAGGGGSAGHQHDVNVNADGSSGAAMDFDVQYIDVIIASKNAP
jgi:hypothetical protein